VQAEEWQGEIDDVEHAAGRVRFLEV